jgi:transposase
VAGKDIIIMTQEELKRLHIIRKALNKCITQAEAADIIGVCLRQVQRIVRTVRAEGDEGVIHKSRGQASNRAVPTKIKSRVLKLYKEKYPDFGPTLATEKLFEIDKVKINDETLRLWLIQGNIPYKKRKKRPHRKWRQRKDCFGEMIQIDGSDHDWFEGSGSTLSFGKLKTVSEVEPLTTLSLSKGGPECVFMGYIDDATSRPFGRFYPYEGTLPAMDSFKRYIGKYGIPLSIYLDKHTTYKSTKKLTLEDELNNTEPLSQFARAVTELGVNVIYADSPQAKGRIERLFGTLQDRLIKEMRLQGIETIKAANKFLVSYLPAYSRRFAVRSANDTDLHRPIPEGINLDRVLCVKTTRVLRNDFTIVHNRKLYQIKDNISAKAVMVEERVNGSMLITHKDISLTFKEIATRPEKEQEEPYTHSPKKIYIPPKDHPWRKFRLPSSVNLKEKEEVLAGAL